MQLFPLVTQAALCSIVINRYFMQQITVETGGKFNICINNVGIHSNSYSFTLRILITGR